MAITGGITYRDEFCIREEIIHPIKQIIRHKAKCVPNEKIIFFIFSFLNNMLPPSDTSRLWKWLILEIKDNLTLVLFY